MTSTHDEAPAAGAPGPQTDPGGPRLNREQLHDIDRLRRTRTDRYVAGVAGGLGRHFGIDPVILRVLFVVTTFFGGAGLLVYLACWLLTPEEGGDRAPIHTGPELRRILLAAIAVIALIGFLGDAWGGFAWHAWPLVLVVAVIAIVLGNRHQERAEDAAGGGGAPAVPAANAYRPVPPPRRTGMLLFLPTLALIAVALGGLGLYATDHQVAPGAWAALALAVIGAMLVVGAFAGRPGGLIALGILTVPILAATTLVGHGDWHDEQITHAPLSAADVRATYDEPNGQTVLDLSRVRDPEALDGRAIDAAIGAGELRVVLPPDVTATVDAEIRYAGDITVLGHDTGGLNPDVHTTVEATTTGTQPSATVQLDLHARVGHIEIVRD